MESMAAAAPRGDTDKALSQSPVGEAHEYRTPMEHHNPMECFGSTACWDEDERLTIYDKTQGAQNSHRYVCNVFGLAKDKVRVVSPFVGGAFGCGLRPQYQLFLAAMAAIALKRSVRVTLTRQQMILRFRPETSDYSDPQLGSRREWTSNGGQARRGRQYLPLRGLPGERRQLGRRALSLRQLRSQSQARAARSGQSDGYAGSWSRGGCLCARMRDGRA